ncbi:ATP-binding protein [Streptomyces sp. YIM 98790]|uniref:ATP-binding protein n=1 Tax=Streptomyces sp. YIM 98790 TaxID=2689077 RepID=UPI00140750C4|nr:ATP-binding protein [Streptomyces sp. YIM 98790]
MSLRAPHAVGQQERTDTQGRPERDGRQVPQAVRSYRLTAPNAPDTAKVARDHVAGLLHHTGRPGPAADVARLLVSEIVTNVYRHTAVRLVTVTTTIRPEAVMVAVHDTSPAAMPAMRRVRPDEEGGRGLRLVQELASAWGFALHGGTAADADATGKSVWFELRSGQGSVVDTT